MRALMTNIPQVDIWAEAKAFFDSITDADLALRIVTATEWPSATLNARPVRPGSAPPVTPVKAERLRDEVIWHLGWSTTVDGVSQDLSGPCSL